MLDTGLSGKVCVVTGAASGIGRACAEILAQDEVRACVARIETAGVPAAAINSVPMVLEEPQVKHREMLRHLPHPLSGTVPQIVSPMRFQQAPLAFERAPPLLGEHTAEILAELGFAESDRRTAV